MRALLKGTIYTIPILTLVAVVLFLVQNGQRERMERELRNTIIPYARFSEETTLEQAAAEVWSLIQKENAFFVGTPLSVEVAGQRSLKASLELSQCPASEWLGYLTESCRAVYVCDGTKVVIVSVKEDRDTRLPFVLRTGVKLQRALMGCMEPFRSDPDDPFRAP